MKQINKVAARKLFDAKKSFWMTACNMRPECGILINSLARHFGHETFEQVYNAFCYYNCNNECGRYPRFYVEEDI